MANEKGYLGPIGDDFPAIFPIAFGLIFFFGSIAVTYDTYTQKKDLGQSMRANLLLSRGVRRETIVNEEYWSEACGFFQGTKANYGVGGYMVVRTEENEVMDLDGTGLFCYEEANGVSGPDEINPSTQRGKRVTLMTYPVAVEIGGQTEKQTRLRTLEVVTWK